MRMDNQLNNYFNQEIDVPKPFINEAKIILELERRKKRKQIMWLSIASLLWSVLFLVSVIFIAKSDIYMCILLFIFAGIQLLAASLLSFVVFKKGKVNLVV